MAKRPEPASRSRRTPMSGASSASASSSGRSSSGRSSSGRSSSGPASSSEKEDAAAAGAGERIAKALSRAGVASRREAERMIAEGRVAVNGRILDGPAVLVGPDDSITVDGAPVAPPEGARLFRYNKPRGLVTSRADERGRETIFDHLPPGLPSLMPVGRLDLTSEGLLLLTNDGALKRRLELPSSGLLRRYRVRAHLPAKTADLDALLQPLSEGIVVDGVAYQPMLVAVDRRQGGNAWLNIGLREGKNREIRRALKAIGLEVNRLIRTAYGPFRLGTLPVGGVDEVRARMLRDVLGVEAETPAARDKRRRGQTPPP